MQNAAMNQNTRSDRHFLAPPQPSHFIRDGFTVLYRFLDEVEVKDARLAVEEVVAAPRLCGACTRPHNTLLPLRWNDSVVRLVLASSARVRALAEAVGAVDPKWISGYVSIKEPRSPALWWHQDWWCWDHPVSFRRPAPQIAVLCYLTATDVGSGALRVLPGSHHRSLPIHALLPERHAESADALEVGHPAMTDQPGQVTLSLAAGDAVVIDYRLLHGTHGNDRDMRRDCILLSFAPSWRDLPADIRGHLIQHPAQPGAGEHPSAGGWEDELLPRFDGVPKSLPLNRKPPPVFEAVK
jgi:Phytanoyl-CoA dioxygenase (PhyH)